MADAIQGHCTGNCMGCTIFQRQYCASQISYNNMNMIGQLIESVEKLSKKVNSLANEVADLQSSDEELINPVEDKAQEASGAEK